MMHCKSAQGLSDNKVQPFEFVDISYFLIVWVPMAPTALCVKTVIAIIN